MICKESWRAKGFTDDHWWLFNACISDSPFEKSWHTALPACCPFPFIAVRQLLLTCLPWQDARVLIVGINWLTCLRQIPKILDDVGWINPFIALILAQTMKKKITGKCYSSALMDGSNNTMQKNNKLASATEQEVWLLPCRRGTKIWARAPPP